MSEFRKCRTCGEEKPHGAFHKTKSRKDGLSTSCGSCRSSKQRVYSKTQAGKAAQVRADQKRNVRFPLRRKARTMLFRAVQRGAVTPMNCWVCGDLAEAHHPDYSAPLDVVWLCYEHHKQAHKAVEIPI